MTQQNQEIGLSMLAAHDDGSSNHKTARWMVENGSLFIKTFVMPAHVSTGIAACAIGQDSKPDTVYSVNGELFTVESNNPMDTRRENYQESNMLLAISQHALYRAGLGGRSVHISTGLPLTSYYDVHGGFTNKDAIQAKENAYLSADVRNAPDADNKITAIDENRLVKVASNTVYPEAIGAYLDYMFTIDGQWNVEGVEGLVLVVDIGSNTIDSCIINTQTNQIEVPTISTLVDSGSLKIMDQIRVQLMSQFKLNTAIPVSELERALKEQRFKLRGTTHDVSEMVAKIVGNHMVSVVSTIKQVCGSQINYVEKILVVGAAANLIANYFGDDLQGLIHVPVDPQFSNVKGFLKAMTYNSDTAYVQDLV